MAESATTSYTYDAHGQLLTATNSIGSITVTDDRLGRQLSVDPDDGSADTEWTYTSFTSDTRVDARTRNGYGCDAMYWRSMSWNTVVMAERSPRIDAIAAPAYRRAAGIG